jgi:hypothetical protein
VEKLYDMPKDTVRMLNMLIPALESHREYASRKTYFISGERNEGLNELLHQLKNAVLPSTLSVA